MTGFVGHLFYIAVLPAEHHSPQPIFTHSAILLYASFRSAYWSQEHQLLHGRSFCDCFRPGDIVLINRM